MYIFAYLAQIFHQFAVSPQPVEAFLPHAHADHPDVGAAQQEELIPVGQEAVQIQIFIDKTTKLYTILNKYLFIEIRMILLITIKTKSKPKIGFLRQL